VTRPLISIQTGTATTIRGSTAKLSECQYDCKVDADCQSGLLCAHAHKEELKKAGYDVRKAYCAPNDKPGKGFNTKRRPFKKVCYDPKKIQGNVGEKYVYVVYYDKSANVDQCFQNSTVAPKSPVAIRTIVTGESNSVVSGFSDSSTCPEEAVCIVSEAASCKLLNNSITGQVKWDVIDGKITECDPTNVPPEPICAEKTGCSGSSIFPRCVFSSYLRQDFINNPAVITQAKPQALDQYSYLMFFSDSECDTFEGLSLVVAGKQELVIPGESVACDEAISCLANPEGARCKNIIATAPTERLTVYTKSRDSRTFKCNAEGNYCAETPSKCTQSPIPSCHYRWVSANDLFSYPSRFF
jgi:hypothetical protein